MALIRTGGGAKVGVETVIIGGSSTYASWIIPQTDNQKVDHIVVSAKAGNVGGDGVKIVHGNSISNTNTYGGLTPVSSALGTIDLSSYNDDYVGIAIDCSGISLFEIQIVYA